MQNQNEDIQITDDQSSLSKKCIHCQNVSALITRKVDVMADFGHLAILVKARGFDKSLANARSIICMHLSFGCDEGPSGRMLGNRETSSDEDCTEQQGSRKEV